MGHSQFDLCARYLIINILQFSFLTIYNMQLFLINPVNMIISSILKSLQADRYLIIFVFFINLKSLL